ncbi:MAG: hypothetical protein IJC04_10130 [Oscillospiraceae bacterium]|nr:hypothetical protein [Oscillospiraceae bacterium]
MRSPTKSVRGVGRLNLFLLEMIIVLLFFSIASAVILKAFVAADRISAENIRLERMAFCAQSVAESFSVTADLAETAEDIFGIDPENIENATYIEIPLKEDCTYSYMEDAGIFLTMKFVYTEYGKGQVYTAINISFKDDAGNVLYEMNSAAFKPERTVLDYGEE